eukprot:gnl/MRDRNA2_/MRDRNA2_96152_c0_seq1.p1 gnl/MRDRNA2_/MRDRNA2_96152_c0~~gnl/MRDRNA2_/MRDRNA2_96152_c0_seq1.p1  ORF type:complete len:476 (+),score=71.26 gnl/MRDRNA2_/MRDRNA2_96152_c0_seq1:83-1510(+)
MPIAPGVAAPELPTIMTRQGSLADCLSPGATPKVYVPPPATSDPNASIHQWCASVQTMPQMVPAPPGNMYGCPPGAIMLVPFPCMINQTGQLVQHPCPVNHSQQVSWAPVTNSFLMPPESDAIQEKIDCRAPGNDAPQFATGIDAAPNSNRIETCDMPAHSEELAANMGTSDCTSLPDDAVIGLGNPRQILADAGLASSVVDLLESSSSAKRAALVAWMQPVVLDLALSANGTHVIQKALELTGGETQIVLSHCLHGHVRRLLDSHHGNHVLQKSIVVMPPHALQFIFHELSFFRGGWAGVSCHRFGCRVVERLLEHCDAALTAPIVEAVVADIDSLSTHPFANYVIQHILEYVPAHRSQVVHALIQLGVPQLAQHRVASNIIERAFDHCDIENQQAMAEAILLTPGAVVNMSFSRYGSYTVRRMLEAVRGAAVLRCMALGQLNDALPRLQASKPSRPIAKMVLHMFSETDGESA